MAQKIQYTNDVNLSEQMVQGSDGRFNVSSRSDDRSYYNSRDKQEAYSMIWLDASTASGDVILYWKNTDTTGKHFVVDSIGLNSQYRADFQLLQVTGTAAGGTSSTPTCLNLAAPRVAQATARTADSSAVTGLTEGVCIDFVSVTAGGHEEMRLHDRLRVGQDGAIAIKCILADTSPSRTWGVVFGYYE